MNLPFDSACGRTSASASPDVLQAGSSSPIEAVSAAAGTTSLPLLPQTGPSNNNSAAAAPHCDLRGAVVHNIDQLMYGSNVNDASVQAIVQIVGEKGLVLELSVWPRSCTSSEGGSSDSGDRDSSNSGSQDSSSVDDGSRSDADESSAGILMMQEVDRLVREGAGMIDIIKSVAELEFEISIKVQRSPSAQRIASPLARTWFADGDMLQLVTGYADDGGAEQPAAGDDQLHPHPALVPHQMLVLSASQASTLVERETSSAARAATCTGDLSRQVRMLVVSICALGWQLWQCSRRRMSRVQAHITRHHLAMELRFNTRCFIKHTITHYLN